MLIDRFTFLLRQGCSAAFTQARTVQRAMELALGTLCSFGRRTVSRAICAVGRQHQDWSADYKLYSRSPWHPETMFDPVLAVHLDRYRQGPVVTALDDTKLRKTGSHVASAFWQYDPLSPPFHANLIYGLRFMQASLIFPHYHEGPWPARAVPVRFVECPALKKPGKRATAEQWQAYRQAKRLKNLSTDSLAILAELRGRLDAMGAKDRPLLAALDGSLCNRTFFRAPLDRTDLVARCRKDARLCFAAESGSRRRYADQRFTPEAVRHDPAIRWRRATIHFAGQWRRIRYKKVKQVLWRRGAGTRPLRLLVIAPQPYHTSPQSRTFYRQPAYLLTTETRGPVKDVIQAGFDRWQIEINHRDEKDILGVGQAQVWAPRSVPRQPAFAVACYSLLLIAGLLEFGPGRTEDFIALPKWRKNARRPSALDLLSLLRTQINETSVCDVVHRKIAENTGAYAYT
jgi:hypothetical protein